MTKYLITSYKDNTGRTCGIFENEDMTSYFLRIDGNSIDIPMHTNFSTVVMYAKSLGFTEEF